MLFNRRFSVPIASGEITVTYRAWDRPRVRIGGRYRLGPEGALEVMTIRTVRVGEVSDADARDAGYDDADTLLGELRRYSELAASSELYEIRFRYIAELDGRAVLADDSELDASAIGAIAARLDRLDAASTHGAWTRATLALIDEHPRVRAGDLAAMAGRERLDFKRDVRKLKALGLTISHEIGYEISPRGRAFLREPGR